MKIFWRFFTPYLLVLILPFVVGFFLYERTVRMVEEDALQENLALLEQSQSALDGRLAEVESAAMQMAADPKINALQHLAEPFEGDHTYQWVETNAELKDYSGYNKFILGYYILFANSDIAISKNLVYRLPEFYTDVFSYTRMSFDRFLALAFGSSYQQSYLPVQAAVRNGKPYEVLTYLQSVGYMGHSSGTVMILMDNDTIMQTLRNIDTSRGGWVYILDEKGNIISSTTDKASLPIVRPEGKQSGFIMPSGDTGNMLVTYTRSAHNGWTYVAGLPKSVILQKVNYLKNFSLLIAFSILVLGLLAALGFAYRNSAPVRRLISSLLMQDETTVKVKEPYRFIQHVLDGMRINNDELQERIVRQVPFLRSAFFDKLFKGGFSGEKELQSLQQHLGLRLQGQRFAAAIVQILSIEGQDGKLLHQLDVQRVLVTDILQQALGETGIVQQLDEDKIALLLCLPVSAEREGAGDTLSRLKQAFDRLNEQMQLKVVLAVGKSYSSLMEMPNSFEEAKKVMQYNSYQSADAIVEYEQLPKENKVYDYPVEVEGRLIRFIQAGEAEQVKKLLADLHQENFVERQLLPAMRLKFVQDVWASMTKVIEQSAVLNTVWNGRMEAVQHIVDTEASPGIVFETIRDAFYEAARHYAEMKISRHVEAGKQLLAYVDEHYHHPDLSLEAVSDQFQLSTKYLSRFFKEQTGYTFSEYLNENRMKKARDMLQQTDASINDISLSSGYYSSNTFCRAFKRHHQISPTQFRELKLHFVK